MVTEEIADILTEEGRSKAYRLKKYCDKDSTSKVADMWKLKKQLWPRKKCVLPVAKKNHRGQLVSAPADLRKLLQKEYKERLRPRPVHPKFKLAKLTRNKVIDMKI